MPTIAQDGKFMSSQYMSYTNFQATRLKDAKAAVDLWTNIVLRHFSFENGYGLTLKADFGTNQSIQDDAFVANIVKLDRINEQICFSAIVANGHDGDEESFGDADDEGDGVDNDQLSAYDQPPNPREWKKFSDAAARYLLSLRNQHIFPGVYGQPKYPLYALVAMGSCARFYALEPQDDHPFECSGISDDDFFDAVTDQTAIDNILVELSEAAWNGALHNRFVDGSDDQGSDSTLDSVPRRFRND